MGLVIAEECCRFLAAELQEVWEQAEYSVWHKENTQLITNVPDTQARFLPAQEFISIHFLSIPIVSLYVMSERKRVQWAVQL